MSGFRDRIRVNHVGASVRRCRGDMTDDRLRSMQGVLCFVRPLETRGIALAVTLAPMATADDQRVLVNIKRGRLKNRNVPARSEMARTRAVLQRLRLTLPAERVREFFRSIEGFLRSRGLVVRPLVPEADLAACQKNAVATLTAKDANH
jgi:hypothetical protein